jgi:hypothetical protein
MPWCPKCGSEYREGFTRCSDCGGELTDTPPLADEVPEAGPPWVALAAFTTSEEAQLARGLLEAEGIPAEIVDQQAHPYPYGAGVLEEITLLVPPDRVAQAERVLDDADAGADTVTEADVEPGTDDSGPREG